MNKKVRILLTLALSTSILAAGCGSTRDQAGSEKTFTYGTMAYGPAMENVGTNPHDTYVGWSTLRYGIGETLFRFTENMQLEPWLARDYEQLDDYTVKIRLKDNITFSNGKKVTGQAVKACLDDLLERMTVLRKTSRSTPSRQMMTPSQSNPRRRYPLSSITFPIPTGASSMWKQGNTITSSSAQDRTCRYPSAIPRSYSRRTRTTGVT